MKVFSVTAARANLFKLVEETITSQDPFTIARGDGEAVVVIPMAEWESMRNLLISQMAAQAPQITAGASNLACAVVTLPTGETTVHGPYGSLDQAGRMGHSIARRKLRTLGVDQEHPVTYRLQTQSRPGGVWVDRTTDRSWEQHWIPATREATAVRRCENCGHDIVRFDGSWAVTSDDELVDGYSSCPPGAPLKKSSMHKPAKANDPKPGS